MAAGAVEPEPVPLARDSVGRLVVMGTRVPLETLVVAFERGDSPEAIHESYPSVGLGDISPTRTSTTAPSQASFVGIRMLTSSAFRKWESDRLTILTCSSGLLGTTGSFSPMTSPR